MSECNECIKLQDKLATLERKVREFVAAEDAWINADQPSPEMVKRDQQACAALRAAVEPEVKR